MIRFVVRNIETQEEIRRGFCPESMLELQHCDPETETIELLNDEENTDAQ